MRSWMESTVIMTKKVPTGPVRVAEIAQDSRPGRSVLRLLARRPGRMSLALIAFAMKEIPLWFLPVITAAIIDIVADGERSPRCSGGSRSRWYCCCRTTRTTSSTRAAS